MAEINRNKPPPFVNTAVDSNAFEGIPNREKKHVERVVLNNINNVKNTFDEVLSKFSIALQSSLRVKSEDTPNIIPTDKTDKIKFIDVLDNYFDTTQDINKDQREKSIVSLVVTLNADDKVAQCSVDGIVKNEQDENINTSYGIDLSSHENMGNVCVKHATSTYVSEESSDEESTPKKYKRFTFTDSDFPDNDEIRDILMSYSKPAVIDSFTESESQCSSEGESCKFLRRFWNKTKHVPKVDLNKMFEKLPERVITRRRKPTFKLLSGGEVGKNNLTMLKPRYLTDQEDQIDEDIILENIKRFKSFKRAKIYKDSENHETIKKENTETEIRKKPDNKSNEHKREVKVQTTKLETKRKHPKTKSITRINPKEDSLNSVSAFKTTTGRTTSKRKENDSRNTQHKCSENKNKKPDRKRKPYEGRRSKRQQEASEKNDDTIKAPTYIHKKSIRKPKQSNADNVASSSSESPKSLKRSSVNSDVPSSRRTRSQNNNNENRISNTSLRATTARVRKTRHVLLTAFPSAEVKQKLEKLDPYVRLERFEQARKRRALISNMNYLTRSQLARKRFYRSCKQTREAAPTLTKWL